MSKKNSIAPTITDQPPNAEIGDKFEAGVQAYASGYYFPDYEPLDTDLICVQESYAARKSSCG